MAEETPSGPIDALSVRNARETNRPWQRGGKSGDESPHSKTAVKKRLRACWERAAAWAHHPRVIPRQGMMLVVRPQTVASVRQRRSNQQ